MALVDADDIADVAVHALTDDRAPNTDLVLTAPEALDHDGIATVRTRAGGRPVVHRLLTTEELRALLASGAPPDFAALLAGLDPAVVQGTEDRTTDTIERGTGRPPFGR
ncbi:hypothetical protein ACFWIK_01890 [Streptomyces anthocyanicus]|uniref:hypothetical protein n=1 Tax=Streptomyces anthocyanicus TaxID=68174 RepID=UPI003664CC41